MDKAKKQLNCDDDWLIELLNRHKQDVESTRKKEYPIKPRSISEFFGQKQFNGTALICAKYDTMEETKKEKTPLKFKREEVDYG